MGSIEYVKFLGEDFNKWVFPSILILMVLLTLFNLYGKILTCIGLKQFSFDSSAKHTKEYIEAGSKIIESYKINRL